LLAVRRQIAKNLPIGVAFSVPKWHVNLPHLLMALAQEPLRSTEFVLTSTVEGLIGVRRENRPRNPWCFSKTITSTAGAREPKEPEPSFRWSRRPKQRNKRGL